jgi:hypothetical protein
VIKKATKKPVEIKYITYEDLHQKIMTNCLIVDADGIITNSRNLIPHSEDTQMGFGEDNEIVIFTLEGEYRMTDKDVLIIGVKGEIYPCKKDIFDLTYDY